MTLVSPDDNREPSALTVGGGTALDVALKVVGALEDSAQRIVQVNDGGEAPAWRCRRGGQVDSFAALRCP